MSPLLLSLLSLYCCVVVCAYSNTTMKTTNYLKRLLKEVEEIKNYSVYIDRDSIGGSEKL